jgi:RNA polymerase sigma factor (sigma-70 family)
MDGNRVDAQDALSQAMMKAMESLPSCAGNVVCPAAWLHRLARNVCIDLIRERNRRSRTAEGWKDQMLSEPTAEAPMIEAEQEAEIERQIVALPSALRDPFLLRVVRGKPVRNVALQLGLSPANVRKRVQLARSRLRREFEWSLEEGSGNGPGDERPLPKPVADRPSRKRCGREDYPPTAVVRTVRVKLRCGVEKLFHVFAAKSPVSPARQIGSLRRYLQAHPGGWKRRAELAELLYVTGDWREAVAQWQQVLAMRPHLPTVFKLAETLLRLGAREEAAPVLNRARPQSEGVRQHLQGWIAVCGKDAPQAVMEFQSAADLEPENSAHWHGLALALHLAGRGAEAVAAIKRALAVNPGDVAALSIGHEILLATGAIEEAMRRAELLLTLVPRDLLTMLRLIDCRCRLKLSQGEAARETRVLLRHSSRLSQNPLLMREPLAAFFLSREEPQKALAVGREFVERHPQCPGGRRIYLHLLAATSQDGRLAIDLRDREGAAEKACNGACQWTSRIDSLQA